MGFPSPWARSRRGRVHPRGRAKGLVRLRRLAANDALHDAARAHLPADALPERRLRHGAAPPLGLLGARGASRPRGLAEGRPRLGAVWGGVTSLGGGQSRVHLHGPSRHPPWRAEVECDEFSGPAPPRCCLARGSSFSSGAHQALGRPSGIVRRAARGRFCRHPRAVHRALVSRRVKQGTGDSRSTVRPCWLSFRPFLSLVRGPPKTWAWDPCNIGPKGCIWRVEGGRFRPSSAAGAVGSA